MSHFITIAGPQSSGKTTAMNFLKEHYKNWYFIDEINPYTVVGKDHFGANYTDKDLQINLLEIELIKLNSIESKYNSIYFDETGIFRLVYADYFYNKKLAKDYYPKYFKFYSETKSNIIFINTEPEISFFRRKDLYRERIKRMNVKNKKEYNMIFNKYKKTIMELYPLWLKFYEKLPFSKFMVNNSEISENLFLKEIDKTVQMILSDSRL